MRTTENIKLMKKVLINELNQLAEENAFGASNEPDRNRLHGWIIDLTYIERFGKSCDESGDVSFWFHDECWSPLCDYENSLKDFSEHEQLLRYAAWLNM